MRKIFLFWIIILIILIAGIAAIIYGKMLLKAEDEKAREIMEELSTTAIPRVDTLPVLPSDMETEEMPEEVEPLEPALPSGVETEEMPEEVESPEPVLPLETQQSLPPVSQ